jgi:hypothetical protein
MDGAVCSEICRKHLIIIIIIIIIYSTVRLHLVGIFKIKLLHKNARNGCFTIVDNVCFVVY